MGKISPVSSKYIVHSFIQVEGVVDRPDVIGAIFGQTEGLLGNELELRELQRSGRIGRIEVKLETRTGKTNGNIIIPSSLDKAETAIIAAALETIQRIGPCNAKIKVEKIEDVRVSKRHFVIDRAKELLKALTENVLPDSQEITDEVAHSVRMMEITEYGKDRLPAGPSIDDAEEVLVVEGRADVLNLLKHGIKNVISLNGTSVPQTIIELSRKKVTIVFVDGDRGGDLIVKELLRNAEIDYAIRAPDGKEVEELTKKEIHKCLRSKISVEQLNLDQGEFPRKKIYPKVVPRPIQITDEEKERFREMLEELVGTRGAYVLDPESNILGKVPTSELSSTIRSLGTDINAIIFDGIITREIVDIAERANIKYLIAMDSKVKQEDTRLNILTNTNI